MKGWLTSAELAAARTHLDALSELFARGRRRPGAELAALAFVLAPLAPSERVRPPPSPKNRTAR
jgi:hypothetical protein